MIIFVIGFVCGYFFASIGIAIYIYMKKHQYDGVVVVEKTSTGKKFSLELNRSPDDLEDEEEIRFLVKVPEEEFRD